ncbi:glycosyltransferase [Candidatus Woesearchaeota archaeon]|nr:glycosyltransferase [Candidatus Woesearchaeota archaeon]
MKIGILAGLKPLTKKKGNIYGISKIISEENEVYLVGYDPNTQKEIEKDLKFRNYTKIKPKNIFLRILRHKINLSRFCKKEKPDILMNIYREEFEGVITVIVAKKFGIKSIVRFAGNPFEAYKHKKTFFNKLGTYILTNIIAKHFLKKATKIITMSEETKINLIKQGFNKKKIEIVMQPMKINIPKANKNLKGLSKTKKNVLFVGNFTKGKGFQSIINILENKTIQQKYNFVFIGADKDNYSKTINKYKNTSILGRLDQEKVFEYMASSDIFLFPSYFEGFPKAVTEAYLCGCPIIARDIVNIDRLAQYTFKTDKELLNIMLNKKIKKAKNNLPEEFTYNYVREKYKQLVREI